MPAHMKWVPWAEYRNSRGGGIRIDSKCRWVAIGQGRGRLRVHRLLPTYELGPASLYGGDQAFYVFSYAWVGDWLVYSGARRIAPELLGDPRDVDTPSLWPTEYLAKEGRCIAWNPETGEQVELARKAFSRLLADTDEGRVVGFYELPSPPDEAENKHTAAILTVPEGRTVATFMFANGEPPDGWTPPRPLGWDSAAGGFLAVGSVKGLATPASEFKTDVAVPIFVNADGQVTDLRSPDREQVRLLLSREVPAPTLVDSGRHMAALVRTARGTYGVAVYSPEKREAWYPFSVRLPQPKELAEYGDMWGFLVCTPDGRGALFQRELERKPSEDPEATPQPVYHYDFASHECRLVCELTEVRQVFEWLPGPILPAAVAAQGMTLFASRQDLGLIVSYDGSPEPSQTPAE